MVMSIKTVGSEILGAFGLVMKEDVTVPTMRLQGRIVQYNPTFVSRTASDHGLNELNFLKFVLTHETLHLRLKHEDRMKQVIANVKVHLRNIFGVQPDVERIAFSEKIANYVYDAEINELIVSLLGLDATVVRERQLGIFKVHIEAMLADMRHQLSTSQLSSIQTLLVKGGPGGLFFLGKVYDAYSDLLSQAYLFAYLLPPEGLSQVIDDTALEDLQEATHAMLAHGHALGDEKGAFREKSTEKSVKAYLRDHIVSFKPRRKRAVIKPEDLARIKSRLAHEPVTTYQRVSRRQYLSPDILKRGRKFMPQKYLVAIDLSVSMPLESVVAVVEELGDLDQTAFDFTFFASESQGDMDPVGRVFTSHQIKEAIPLVQIRHQFYPYSSQESYQFERYDESQYKFIVVVGDFEYGMAPEFRDRKFDERNILNVKVKG
jgi:hypothetical protein